MRSNEILWCDHSNETFFVVLSCGTVCLFFSVFLQIEIWDFLFDFDFWHSWDQKGLQLNVPVLVNRVKNKLFTDSFRQ